MAIKSALDANVEADLRIGVFICKCGLNIGGTVNCEAVTEYADTLDDVVFTQLNTYTCSSVGQAEIKSAIKEHNLNRVLVASCTPRLHEPTFRRTCEEAGLNPFLFEQVNIREHCSWVHLHEKDKATAKAKDLVKMGVAKVRLLQPLKALEVPVIKKAMVVGAGVAGIQAALELAGAGYKVYLIEKEPSIGGRMAQIDKTFPTMDCSICILAPKMTEVAAHENIELYANSEITNVEGFIGNFKVTVHVKPRYVTDKCTACGDCTDACSVLLKNEFDAGLVTRKAIYIPFPQAVPPQYLIDIENCLGLDPLACDSKCKNACEADAIDYDMQPQDLIFDVGTIIIATGLSVFDASKIPEYGYSKFENVITSLEFERLINAGGPSHGTLIRPQDKSVPKNVAFIQCVGSRSKQNKRKYCSNICCMNTIKDSLLIKEHWPDIAIDVYYQDIRAFGKSFEDLYMRSKKDGVRYIRGLPGEIKEIDETKNLLIRYEDRDLGRPVTKEYDLIVLSIGLESQPDSEIIQRLFNLSRTSDGFFLESHPKLKPVDAPTPGIFFAGCAEAPKDIKDSVTQACAAASRANMIMSKGYVTVEPLFPRIDPELCNKCGLCAKVCPYHAIDIVKGVTVAKVIEAACAGCGTCGAECLFGAITMQHFTDAQILAEIDAITEHDADKKVVAFCCNWCSYAGADFAGVSRMQYPPEIRIIRTMCSGRVAENFVLHAFERGAAAVLVAGCHLNDCHYIDANYQTKKRIERLWNKFERLGIDKNRLHLAWISAAEGEKFAKKAKEMSEIVQKVTRSEITKTTKLLKKKS